MAAHSCGTEESGSKITVTDFAKLKEAVGKDGVTDIVLTPESGDSAEWTWTDTLTISRPVHIYVAEGKTVTLKRTNVDKELFNVQNGGTLTLGNGMLTWNGEDGKENEAYQNGDYTVTSAGGHLIIDGGAVWKKGAEYVPGGTPDGGTPRRRHHCILR